MKIIIRKTGEVIGEVVTNHSMDIYTACDLAGVDTEDYDVEDELEMDCTENVRYECVSGYMDAPKGEYEIGEEIEGIGAVQSIGEIGE